MPNNRRLTTLIDQTNHILQQMPWKIIIMAWTQRETQVDDDDVNPTTAARRAAVDNRVHTTTTHHLRRRLRQLDRNLLLVTETIQDMVQPSPPAAPLPAAAPLPINQLDEEDHDHDHDHHDHDDDENVVHVQLSRLRHALVDILTHLPLLLHGPTSTSMMIMGDAMDVDDEAHDGILRVMEQTRHLFALLQARLAPPELIQLLELVLSPRNSSCSRSSSSSSSGSSSRTSRCPNLVTLSWLQAINQTWNHTDEMISAIEEEEASPTVARLPAHHHHWTVSPDSTSMTSTTTTTTTNNNNNNNTTTTNHHHHHTKKKKNNTLLDAATCFHVVQHLMPRGIATLGGTPHRSHTVAASLASTDAGDPHDNHVRWQWRILLVHAWKELRQHFQYNQQQQQQQLSPPPSSESNPATLSFREWIRLALEQQGPQFADHYLFQAVEYYLHELVESVIDTLDDVAHALALYDDGDDDDGDDDDDDNHHHGNHHMAVWAVRDALRQVHLASLSLQVMNLFDEEGDSKHTTDSATTMLVRLWKIMADAFVGSKLLKQDTTLDAYCCETLLELAESASHFLGKAPSSTRDVHPPTFAGQSVTPAATKLSVPPIPVLCLTLLRAINHPHLLVTSSSSSTTAFLQLVQSQIPASTELRHVCQIAILQLQQQHTLGGGHTPIPSNEARMAAIHVLMQILEQAVESTTTTATATILLDPWDHYFARQLEERALSSL